MVRIGLHGYRDGKFRTKNISIEPGIAVVDFFMDINASADNTIADTYDSSATTAKVPTRASNCDVPRVLKLTNAEGEDCLLETPVNVTGRDAQGRAVTERFNIPRTDASVINGSVAFSIVTSIVQASTAFTTTTYCGTTSVGYTDILGLTYPIISKTAVIQETRYDYASPVAVPVLGTQFHGDGATSANNVNIKYSTIETKTNAINGANLLVLRYRTKLMNPGLTSYP